MDTELRRNRGQHERISKSVKLRRKQIVIGTQAYDKYCRLRGAHLGTNDLGELESIALCLDASASGRLQPFVTQRVQVSAGADCPNPIDGPYSNQPAVRSPKEKR